MRFTLYDSPLGALLLAAEGTGLSRLSFQTGSHPAPIQPGWKREAAFFADVVAQLDAYFAGALEHFDLALAPSGTSFQRRVWDELRRIPFGTTISYAELAQRVQRPKAVRAVGAANGANPIPVVIPCHRVIGSDGKLTGYGGGIEIKEKLLAHEGALLRF